MTLSWPRPSPLARLSLGLVALLLLLMLILDLIFQVMPDRVEQTRRLRTSATEAIAAQVVLAMQPGATEGLGRLLDRMRERDHDLLSLALRRSNGELVAQSGDHGQHWTLAPTARPTLSHMRIELMRSGEPWGDIELAFRPTVPEQWYNWFSDPLVRNMTVLLASFFLAAYLFLKQSLMYLDPGSAIPDRVRMAYDALSEGVLIIDPAKRVMLANRAFRTLHPSTTGALTGQALDKMPWLYADLGDNVDDYPWSRAMTEGRPISEAPLRILQPNAGEARDVIVSCSPVLDGKKKVRGCLIAFSDVTELHRTNNRLRATIDELESSREQIRQQNEELHRLATRDPLTGCLNRRAFFEQLETQFLQASLTGEPIGCVMTDIDHFKQFNDRHGHAVGDQVLQAVARALGAGIRAQDMLCRYGGEEFSIILIGMDAAKTAEVADRLRQDIEANAGASVRSSPGLTVTSSFGVSQMIGAEDTPERMIDRADQALYAAKHGGRNRVCIWHDSISTH